MRKYNFYFILIVEMDDLLVFKENELIYNRDVMKFGRIIGIIYGCFFGEIELVKIEKNLFFENYFILFDFYIVNDILEILLFFKGGDFGFGVVVVGNLNKVLGIVIVYLGIRL